MSRDSLGEAFQHHFNNDPERPRARVEHPDHRDSHQAGSQGPMRGGIYTDQRGGKYQHYAAEQYTPEYERDYNGSSSMAAAPYAQAPPDGNLQDPNVVPRDREHEYQPAQRLPSNYGPNYAHDSAHQQQRGVQQFAQRASMRTSDYSPPPIASNHVRLVGKCGSAETPWDVLQAVLHQMFHKPILNENIAITKPITNQPAKSRSSGGGSHGGGSHGGGSQNGAGKRAYKNTVCRNGYRWLKYGQKLLTNSKLHREYFRCADSNCTAKKHVEVEPATGRVVSERSTPHNHGAVHLDSAPAPKRFRQDAADNRSISQNGHSPKSYPKMADHEATHTSRIAANSTEIANNNQASMQVEHADSAE